MKKNFLLYFLFSNISILSFAQAGEWTWVKGNNSSVFTATYGTQGVPDIANTPSGLYECFSWRDRDNNLWLFGGLNITNISAALWKYDISSNRWTWMKGPSSYFAPGVYGTLGVPSPNNFPGARGYGGYNWTDSSGNFWLYGGWGYTTSGFGLLSDLWMYNPVTNEWTWMSGSSALSQNPVYGSFQVPSATANPGGRAEIATGWVDNADQLWLYGGQAISGAYGDVWKYDLSINEWAWMNGSSTLSTPINNGPKGVFDPSYTPGGRWVYGMWKDESGNGWIFGGSIPNTGLYADLWEYDVATNEWGWISGSLLTNDLGLHGNACESSVSFYPAARFEDRANWVDNCQNFWMYSGSTANETNDLWTYNTTNNEWTFIKGSFTPNQYPVFGTQGIASPSNDPGLRYGAVSWTDTLGNLWMYGGISAYSGYINDLWKFTPDPTCPATAACYSNVVAFISSNPEVCQKFCTDFFDQSLNSPTSWLWQFPGGSPATSTDQNPTNICYNNPGTYDVTLITTNATGIDTLTLPGYITVYPSPPLPTITLSGNTLTCSPAANYQWQFNNVDIPGATNQSYDVLQSGYYSVNISDSNGCNSSAIIYVLISGMEGLISDLNVSVYPNPSHGSFTIDWLNDQVADQVSIEVYNAVGQIVFSSEEKIHSNHFSKLIELKNPSEGIYTVELKTEKNFFRKKLILNP